MSRPGHVALVILVAVKLWRSTAVVVADSNHNAIDGDMPYVAPAVAWVEVAPFVRAWVESVGDVVASVGLG